MSKSIKLLMVLVLFVGVTACSGTETEPEAVDEVAIEEVAEEAPVEEVVEEAPADEAADEAPASGAVATFSFVVDGEFPAGTEFAVIDTQAMVIGVNRPDDAEFDMMTVDNGDSVQGSTYEPEADDLDVGIAAGTSYNVFMITQEDGSQALVVWSPDDPMWQDLLQLADTVVAGIGAPGPNTLMRGDAVQISVQPSEDGGIDVTLDVTR